MRLNLTLPVQVGNRRWLRRLNILLTRADRMSALLIRVPFRRTVGMQLPVDWKHKDWKALLRLRRKKLTG